MSKTAAPTPPRSDAAEVRQQLAGKHVCPFCGVMRADAGQPCPRCTLDDTTATRQATRQRVGPWFVLQARNPSAPGMKLATLQTLVRRGHVTPRSVVRGPSTEQLWAFAAGVRGLSREFGLCFHCQESLEPVTAQCPHCGRAQDLVGDPDAMIETPTDSSANGSVVVDTPRPLAPPAPSLAPPAAALPPPFGAPEPLVFSSLPSSDTGMDGGTSLDLQADPHPPLARATPRPLPDRPAERRPPPDRPAVDRPFVDRPSVDRPAVDRPPVDRPSFERPAAARPPAPMAIQRVAPKEETILTARELAAAFQLDFKQPAANARAGRTAARPVRTLAGLLLIAALATAVVLGLRADWRQQAFAWLTDRWGRVAASLEQPSGPHDRTPAKPATPSGGQPGGSPAPTPSPSPSPTPTLTPSPTPAATPVVTVAKSVPPVTPLPGDARSPVPPAVGQTPPPPRDVPAPVVHPEPPPEPVVRRPAAPPEPPVAVPAAVPAVIPGDLTIDQATTLGVELRNRAIDAEARKDWSGAARLYEQIQQLPRDAWPADLPMRLDIARRRAAQ